MKLFQIESSIHQLLSQEEVTQETLNQALVLDASLHQKLDDMLAFQQEKETELKAFEAFIKEKLDAIKKEKAKNDSLKEFIKNKCLEYGIQELKSKHFISVKLANTGGANPVILSENIDIDSIPQRFIKTTKEISKTAIKEALEAGEILEFAHFGEKSKTLKIK